MSSQDAVIGDAGKRRYLAAVIDSVLVFVPTMALAARVAPSSTVAAAVVLTVVFVGYFVVFELIWGATPGKAVFGLKVCSTDGQPCSAAQIVVRNLLRLVDANPILLGALPGALFILLTTRRQRLGDIVAKTIVRGPLKEQATDRSIVEEFD